MINIDQIEDKARHTKAEVGALATKVGSGKFYTKDVLGVVEGFYLSDAGVETQLTSGGSVSLPAIPSLVPSGGAKDSILAKSSASDYATTWKKPHQLINEFFFVLPKAVSIDARVTLLGNVVGLELFSADNDLAPDDEFGLLPSTLIIKPKNLTGVVLGEIDIMELNDTGAIETQGWNKLATQVVYKSNKAMDRAGLIDFGSQLDAARDVFVKVRFFNLIMP